MSGSGERGARVRVLPPLLFLVPFLLAWLIHRVRPWSLPEVPGLRPAGLVLLLLALALMGWAALTMARHRTTVVPWEPVSALVTTGPFARSRNPIYLADVVAYLGGSLVLASWWPLLLLPLAVVAARRLVIDREEAYLRERFGASYEAYVARVRRWV